MKNEPQEHVEALTSTEQKLLTTAIKELRQTGLLPNAIKALDKKHALNRMENKLYEEEQNAEA